LRVVSCVMSWGRKESWLVFSWSFWIRMHCESVSGRNVNLSVQFSL